MRLSFVAAVTGLLGLASARIEGFAVPKTIKPGESFDAVLMGYNYIQTVAEIAAAFGVQPGQGYPGAIGTSLGSVYLGPANSNKIGNLSFPVTIPADTAKGQASVSAALFQIYGASGSPSVEIFNLTVTLGDVTSTEYVSTDQPQ
ncbi:hypothetical protein MPDQ_000597 [Monascus purpureus]|uniref:Uncharacterized protein n=1 Tax=Monascus purpureus TaxID=5098 RepID=A0A507QRB6_MONPU|nr:hypothetical protein MPDQ_000597 [Monascus purpureus]BDD63679.1 hypothetical protein MAP00_008547 [Monascus purpureus]